MGLICCSSSFSLLQQNLLIFHLQESHPSFEETYEFFKNLLAWFLDASMHLNKRICPSICPSIRPSFHPWVHRFITHFFQFGKNNWKNYQNLIETPPKQYYYPCLFHMPWKMSQVKQFDQCGFFSWSIFLRKWKKRGNVSKNAKNAMN